jgi:HEAT repeat protein
MKIQTCCLFLMAVCACGPLAFAQSNELQMIAALKTELPRNEKITICQELGRVGTKEAIAPLAALLDNPELAHAARYGLEMIPEPAVDEALREAAGRVKGLLLVGVLQSIGNRRDAKAISLLAKSLGDADQAIVGAAAIALGKIATPAAGEALKPMLGKCPSVAEAYLACAVGAQKPKLALSLYADIVKAKATVPKSVRMAAMRGQMLVTGTDDMALWEGYIKSDDPDETDIALRTALEFPKSKKVTKSIAQMLAKLPAKQSRLSEILAERGDLAAEPELLALAKGGGTSDPEIRLAAATALTRLGRASVLPIVMELAAVENADISARARALLVGFSGKEGDSAILALLENAEADKRLVGISLAASGRVGAAVPKLLSLTGDADAKVSEASFKALGDLVEANNVPALLAIVEKTSGAEAATRALLAVCVRIAGAGTGSALEPVGAAYVKAQGKVKQALLKALCSVGNAQALEMARAAITQTTDAELKETATRLVCEWKTREALPELEKIAQEATTERLKILALRGYVRIYMLEPVSQEDKEAAMIRARGWAVRDEERTMIDATLKDIRQPTSDEKGFKPMFNGKNLNQWETTKSGPWWHVVEGVLTAESTPVMVCKTNDHLIWKGGTPGDFELRTEFRLSKSANSGIQMRSEAVSNKDTGYQADMNGGGNYVGFLYHPKMHLIGGRGEKVTLAADGKKTAQRFADAAELQKVYKVEDWNSYRVICHGPDITLYVNDVLMSRFTDLRPDSPKQGTITLQMHAGPPMKIEYRNLRIKMLK